MKEILDDIGQNQDQKKELLKGRQVDLAEELSKKHFILFQDIIISQIGLLKMGKDGIHLSRKTHFLIVMGLLQRMLLAEEESYSSHNYKYLIDFKYISLGNSLVRKHRRKRDTDRQSNPLMKATIQ